MKSISGLIPDIQASVICDDVRQERNGKFILIGIFDAISAPEIPVRYGKLFTVTRWCSGEGLFIQKTRILQPNTNDVLLEGKAIKVQLPNTESSATNVEVFMNVTFEEFGTYWIEILLDDDLVIRYPLRVHQLNSSGIK
ncbi:MAG: hypothetical protein EOL87_05515 [Spartobacteria bacterium]|nr:hypothetical protein [Spartobacteria bacterium]